MKKQKKRGIPDLFAYDENDDIIYAKTQKKGKKGGTFTLRKPLNRKHSMLKAM